ncbi:MAG: TetR/AcrR family transcriptional regulator [Alphaproteobacteria bacterium]
MSSAQATKTTPTKTTKGARTRAALKQAACDVLESTPYHDMRIQDITTKAGVATGLYYHYFPDLKSLLVELVTEMIERIEDVEALEGEIERGDWFGRLRAHVKVVVEAYMAQPGLMRCLQQMSSESPELAALWRRSTERRLGFLIDNLGRLFPDVQLSEKEQVFFSYSLGGIGDIFLSEYFVHRLAELQKFDTNADEIAELIAATYYRAMFAQAPPASSLKYMPNLAKLKRGK